jgi:methylglyoxal synthase
MQSALIAHDGRKADVVSFVMKRLRFFNRPEIELELEATNQKTAKILVSYYGSTPD